MDGRVIIWSKKASSIFDETLSFFKNHNSQSLHEKVKSLTLRLLMFPHLGKPVENTNIRQFIIENYSIYYCVFEAEILIVLFWDNRRNPELLESELGKILNLNS